MWLSMSRARGRVLTAKVLALAVLARVAPALVVLALVVLARAAPADWALRPLRAPAAQPLRAPRQLMRRLGRRAHPLQLDWVRPQLRLHRRAPLPLHRKLGHRRPLPPRFPQTRRRL